MVLCRQAEVLTQVTVLLRVIPTPHKEKALARDLPRHGLNSDHSEVSNRALTLTRRAICKQPWHSVLSDSAVLAPAKLMPEAAGI